MSNTSLSGIKLICIPTFHISLPNRLTCGTENIRATALASECRDN